MRGRPNEKRRLPAAPPEGVGHLLENPPEGLATMENPSLRGVVDGIHPLVVGPVGDGDLVEVGTQRANAGGVAPHQRTDTPEEAEGAGLEAVGAQGGGDGVGGHGGYLLHLMD